MTKMRARAKKVVRGAPERRHLDPKPKITGHRLALRHAGLPDGVNRAKFSIWALNFDTYGVWGMAFSFVLVMCMTMQASCTLYYSSRTDQSTIPIYQDMIEAGSMLFKIQAPPGNQK